MLHVMHMTDVKSITWLGVIAIIGALLMIIGCSFHGRPST